MQLIKTKILNTKQTTEINALWNKEYPKNLADRFNLLLVGIEKFHHHLILDTNENIMAWAVDFERDHAIWFSIIVDSAYQGKGYGSKLLDNLKHDFIELFGWVIDHNNDCKNNGQTYPSPLAFYLQNGFKILAHSRLETEIISAVKIYWHKKPIN